MTEIIEQIKEEAKRYFKGACPSHDWSHVERVYSLCMKIGKEEGADLFVLQLAALLHDIGRKKESENSENVDHAEISRELASQILEKYELNGKIAEQILHCISAHRFRNNQNPETLEAKILFDADKLDCIGAIGIARAYAWAGRQGSRLYSDKDFLGTDHKKEHTPVTEFLFKLSKIKNSLQTETAKKIAEERHKYTLDYFQRLKKEIQQS